MELWSWVLSLTGFVGMVVVGRKHWSGWAILLGSEVLWVIYALTTDQLGFILGSLLWGAAYVSYLHSWRRDKRAHAMADAIVDALTED